LLGLGLGDADRALPGDQFVNVVAELDEQPSPRPARTVETGCELAEVALGGSTFSHR